MARAAPTAAAGRQAIAQPRSARVAICRTDAPRARSTVNSAARRTASMRAASSSTAAAITVRLANRSHATSLTADWVAMNAASGASMPVVMVRSPDPAATSADNRGVWLVARFRAAYRA